jgi:hypothetical protein
LGKDRNCFMGERLVHTPKTIDRPTPSVSWIHWLAGIVVCALAFCGIGCRGSAYNDVYQQRLASEIRVLEDQLYEADYQNQVLKEKLDRATLRAQETQRSETSSRNRSPIVPRPKNLGRQIVPDSSPSFVPTPEPLDLSPDYFDLGDDQHAITPGLSSERVAPSTPEALPKEANQSLSEPGSDQTLPKPIDSKPNGSKPRTSNDTADPFADDQAPMIPPKLMPAPTEPQPPGKADLQLPELDLGTPVPPNSSNGTPDEPPGKIELPGAIQSLSPGGAKVGTPSTLQIHPGLSAAHTFDDGSEGLYLIVNVLDEQNRPLDLEQVQVSAALTVVAVEPGTPNEETLIGRWEFSPNEVSKLVRNEPVSGLAIPVRWREKRPNGERVEVHVRLKNADEEFRCQETLSAKLTPVVAEWTPRSPKATRK